MTDCRESYVTDVEFYRIRHMSHDSTAKNTRLFEREFIPNTEHLEVQFLVL